MMYISIFELVYSIVDIVVEPTIHSHGFAFVVFRSLKESIFNDFFSYLLINVFCGFFGFSLALFGVHFVYRYGAVQKQFFNKYLSGKKSRILFMIPVFYGCGWGTLCYFTTSPDKATDDYMRKTIFDSYDVPIESLSYICVMFYIKENGKTLPNIPIFISLGVMWVMVITSISTVLYFGIKCYLEISSSLSKTSIISPLTKNLQHQLFQALVVQTMIPFILMYIPVTILFSFPMLSIDVGYTTSFVGITVAFFPAIDPLPNMFIIKTYRKAIFEFFTFIFNFLLCRRQKHSATIYTTQIERVSKSDTFLGAKLGVL